MDRLTSGDENAEATRKGPPSGGEAAKASTHPRCKCGHDRTHLMVSAEGKYTLMGWFWVTVMGVTTRPWEVRYRCRACGEVFDSSRDPAALDAMA
jgi:hypothetical protein